MFDVASGFVDFDPKDVVTILADVLQGDKVTVRLNLCGSVLTVYVVNLS